MVDVGPAGRLSDLRERLADIANRRTAALAVLAGVLVVAGLAGLLWAPDAEEPTRPDVAAATSAAPVEPLPAPDQPSEPSQAEDWAAVVGQLYDRRAAAFAAGAVADLDAVYAPGSALLAADRTYVQELAANGEALRGFAPEVVRVAARAVGDDRVELDVVDRWPDYELVAARRTGAVSTEAGRAESAVRMVLVRGDDGWRIETAVRRG